MTIHKICKKCKKSLTLSNFSKSSSSKDKLDRNCRSCKSISQKELKARREPIDYSHIDYDKKVKCSNCDQFKKLSEFTKNRSKKNGFDDRCAICSAKKNLEKYYRNREKYISSMKERYSKIKTEVSQKTKKLRKENPDFFKNQKLRNGFGITIEQYKEMLRKQNNVCAICNHPERIIDRRLNRPRSLAVDHDHKTKKVRGLLCMGCNQGLGNIRESHQTALRMAKYIREHVIGES